MFRSIKNHFILIIISLLLIRGEYLFSNMLNNTGLIFYNNLLVSSNINSDKVLNLLRKAIDIHPANRFAGRNLGFYYLTSLQEDKAIVSWVGLETMSNELLTRGNLAEDEMKYEEALRWYRLAQDISPDLGDAWFYMGRIYQKQENWDLALEAYQESTQKNTFYHDIKSDAYFQQGVIYQNVQEYQNVILALEMYTMALELDRFDNAIIKAEAFYKRGETSEWLAHDLEQVTADYREALIYNPNHVPARLRLGYNLYWLEQDVAKAEFYIQPAIEIWSQQGNPNLDWAYRLLGDVYFDAGLMSEAKLMYQATIDLKPQNQYVQDKLELLGNEE